MLDGVTEGLPDRSDQRFTSWDKIDYYMKNRGLKFPVTVDIDKFVYSFLHRTPAGGTLISRFHVISFFSEESQAKDFVSYLDNL